MEGREGRGKERKGRGKEGGGRKEERRRGCPPNGNSWIRPCSDARSV